MGHATERISGKLNETEAPAAAIVWNDAGEEPDLAAQDMEEDIRTVTADTADFGKRADVFFCGYAGEYPFPCPDFIERRARL